MTSRGLRRASRLALVSALMLTPMVSRGETKAPQTAPPAVPAPAPATSSGEADAGPSNFVLCDGAPNKASALGTAARVVAVTALVGLLLPPPEIGDPKKRLFGADGVRACGEALHGKSSATDPGRRVQLIFALAIHHMEVADWDGALADLRSVATDQPTLVATPDYQQSLGLTAMNLEAFALTGKGDLAGAQAKVLAMSAAAPYDLVNQLRAEPFLQLTEGAETAKDAYYAQLARLSPATVRNQAIEWAARGRFVDAADDYLALGKVLISMPKGKQYGLEAVAACGYRLGGKAADADRLMTEARAAADAEVAAGKDPSTIAFMSEYSDFYDLLVALDSGQALRARTLFTARSRWTSLPAGYVAELARRLATVGTPAEQAATPIQTAQQIMAAYRTRFVAMINTAGDKGADRWKLTHIPVSVGDFAGFAHNVWRTEKSRYIRGGNDPDWNADHASVVDDGSGIPGAYALLLHLAAVAKARGKAGFMLMPGQTHTYEAFYHIGNPDDPGIAAPMMFNADKVIADLGPLFPRPDSK